MKIKPAICLIGDILVDVTLPDKLSDIKLRLGGIVHAARALWACNIPFDVYYFAPLYMDSQIREYLTHLGCDCVAKLGDITGAPYVMLISEAKEIGPQGYEFLLRDELKVVYDLPQFDNLRQTEYREHLVIAGNFDLNMLVDNIHGNIHIDVSNSVQDLTVFTSLKKQLETIFVSTSSDIFKHYFKSDFTDLVRQFENHCTEVILKENRGGSRGYSFRHQTFFQSGCQPRKIAHSVGIGDVFDATYISTSLEDNEQKLVLSSWIAAEYAVTSFPDDFKKGCSRVLKSDVKDLAKMPGISLPWEIRQNINIYIAAPDFSFVDVSPIDVLEKALQYHNFICRRPVKENGQMEENASKARSRQLVSKDIALLEECSLMVSVLLFNDPGTLIEIGYASAKGMPIIVYDPYKLAANCMLTELPDLVSDDLDEVISEIFNKSANLKNYAK